MTKPLLFLTVLGLTIADGSLLAQCADAISAAQQATPGTPPASVANPGNAVDLTDGDISTSATLTSPVASSLARLGSSFNKAAYPGDSIIVLFGIPVNAAAADYSGTAFQAFATSAAGASPAGPVTSAPINDADYGTTSGNNRIARVAVPVNEDALSLRVDFGRADGAETPTTAFVYDISIKRESLVLDVPDSAFVCRSSLITLTAFENTTSSDTVDVVWLDADKTTELEVDANLTGDKRCEFIIPPGAAEPNPRWYYVGKREEGCPQITGMDSVLIVYDDGMCGFPVNLINLRATSDENIVQIHWETAQEVNSAFYSVERSGNAKDWTAIGKITSRNDAGARLKTYRFHDPFPKEGINYYRLKMVDRDGTFEYSKIVRINILSLVAEKSFLAFPNPTSDRISLKNIDLSQVKEVTLAKPNGARMLRIHEPKDHHIHVKKMPAGLYVVTVTFVDGKRQSAKVIIRH